MPRNPKANPASFAPSKAPTQILPASLVAIANDIGVVSRSDSPQTSRSTSSACFRSSRLCRFLIVTAALELSSTIGRLNVESELYARRDANRQSRESRAAINSLPVVPNRKERVNQGNFL